MSDLPILYSFRRCPYAIRARLALLASETVVEIREVKLSAKPPEMIAISPKATVPVLLLADGRIIDQSLDIMRWALVRNDPAGWLSRNDEALVATNDGPFKHHLDRAKYPHRYGEDATFHRAACIALLIPLEDRLGHVPYLCGDAFGLADAALLPFVRQFASIDRAWFDTEALPNVGAWLDSFLGSALFETAMHRFAPWQQGDPERRFPF